MGGGGNSSATPTTPPGYSGGSVMDYNPPPVSNFSPSGVSTGLFGLNQAQWSGIGKGIGSGFSSYGQGIASGGSAPQSNVQTPQFASTPIEGASPPFALIPQTSGGGDEIIQALHRLGIL